MGERKRTNKRKTRKSQTLELERKRDWRRERKRADCSPTASLDHWSFWLVLSTPSCSYSCSCSSYSFPLSSHEPLANIHSTICRNIGLAVGRMTHARRQGTRSISFILSLNYLIKCRAVSGAFSLVTAPRRSLPRWLLPTKNMSVRHVLQAARLPAPSCHYALLKKITYKDIWVFFFFALPLQRFPMFPNVSVFHTPRSRRSRVWSSILLLFPSSPPRLLTVDEVIQYVSRSFHNDISSSVLLPVLLTRFPPSSSNFVSNFSKRKYMHYVPFPYGLSLAYNIA